jgi:pimeloyl-ACP methyl ester carboxylesterase
VRKFIHISLILALLALVVFLLTPSALVNSAVQPSLPADIESYIAERERTADERYGLIPETGKRIRWQASRQPTEYAVVYLHGFSATRQAFAPAAELVADALGANLFEPMADFHAEDWLDDAAEALTIGTRIGRKVVVIGTSTGATLALAMAEHPAIRDVSALILISPNFAPADDNAQLLTGPAGPFIARLVVGDTRTWTPYNVDAVVEMMRLVDYTQSLLPMTLERDLLVLLSPEDQVISISAARQAFDRIAARRKQLIEIHDVGDPSNHILAGDIMSPGTTADVVATIVSFVRDDD